MFTYAFYNIQADLLWGLPNLRHLERGDFLADVIEGLHDGEVKMTNSKTIRRIPSLKVRNEKNRNKNVYVQIFLAMVLIISSSRLDLFLNYLKCRCKNFGPQRSISFIQKNKWHWFPNIALTSNKCFSCFKRHPASSCQFWRHFLI